jgi:hypothetical protein
VCDTVKKIQTKKKMIQLHITGFGPFLDVTENPSSTIMRLVAKHFSESNQKEKVKVLSQTELEVSVQAVERYIQEMVNAEQQQQQQKYSNEKSSSIVHFFLHFGINRGSEETVAIETEAENCVWIPPNDHSKFDSYYCAKISPDDTDPQKNKNSSINEKEIVSSIIPEEKFTGDNAGDQLTPVNDDDEQQQQIKKPPSTTTPVVCTRITALQSVVKEICAQSFNKMIDVVKRKGNEINEKFRVAPSANAGNYLCNMLCYLSLFKLSSLQSIPSMRAFNMKVAAFLQMFHSNVPFLVRESKNNEEEQKLSVVKREKNHSLFIHVMDPTRVSEEQQAEVICVFLEKLFEKLLLLS